MIQLIPTTLGGTSPSVYGVEIDEKICQGYNALNLPTVTVTAVNNGSVIASGGVTMQKVTFAITVTYQPCSMSSETRVKSYAETALVSVPGTVTSVTPTVSNNVTVQASRICCGNRANGVKILTSVSVAYA